MSGDAVLRATDAIAVGRMVAVVDDGRDEPEIDLVAAGVTLTVEVLHELRRLGSGEVFVPVTPDRLDALNIPLMLDGTSSANHRQAGFSVTVDLDEQQPYPMSAAGIVGTVRALANFSFGADRFLKPGHVTPLRGRKGGVLRRIGHTEASIDLAALAGLPGVAVQTSLLDESGQFIDFEVAKRLLDDLDVPIIKISEIIRHRRSTEKVVLRRSEANLPTAHGTFRAIAFRDTTTDEDHVALTMGDVTGGPPPLVRVHSECLTGDSLGSLRCDCGEQLRSAMVRVAAEGRGVVIYLRQEGRGIGLASKIRAYQLQDQGLDTVDANRHLGFAVDLRDYGVGAQILRELGLYEIRLLTNNPKKTEGFTTYGLQVVEQTPLSVKPSEYNRRYLDTKRARMGHAL